MGGGRWQRILFEKVPKYCKHCSLIGHDVDNCWHLRKNDADRRPSNGVNNAPVGANSNAAAHVENNTPAAGAVDGTTRSRRRRRRRRQENNESTQNNPAPAPSATAPSTDPPSDQVNRNGNDQVEAAQDLNEAQPTASNGNRVDFISSCC